MSNIVCCEFDSGKSLGNIVPIEPQDIAQTQRLGFMLGECRGPDNFDTMLSDEIQELFED